MTKQDFERLIANIRSSSLKDFTAPAKTESSLLYSGKSIMFNVDRSDIPVPELIQFILAVILKSTIYGPEEKLRWEIPFHFKKISCAFALQKFGLRLYVSSSEDNATDANKVAQEIIGKLKKAIHQAEKILLIPFANQQIKNGHVTISNQYHTLENRYIYFREKATKASKRRRNTKAKNVMEDIAQSLNHMYKSKSELFYNTIAMLDAFFSLLEHIFVLVVPLHRYNINLVEFIGSYWSDKFKILFDIKKDSKAKSFYDALDNIKEHYRNFYAHGGFEKGGASLHIHFPGIGAIPAQLSRIKNSPHFNFFPIEIDNFQEICKTIDEFNKWLRSEASGLKRAIQYAESGLNIPCDRKSIEKIRAAMKSEKELDALIRYYSYLLDMHTNMDY